MLMKKYSRTYKIGISEDDYLQMARIKLLQSINEYREDQEASFYHYFCNVFHNLLIDLYRHSLREKHIVSLDSCIQEEEGSYCLLDIMEKPKRAFMYPRISASCKQPQGNTQQSGKKNSGFACPRLYVSADCRHSAYQGKEG